MKSPRGKLFHVSGLANRVKQVLKAQVSIESRVFKTRDAIIINSFKIGQLTILLDTHCYLARGFKSGPNMGFDDVSEEFFF